MGITRQGPIMNMDTDQPLVMLPAAQRLTRAKLHRLLLVHGIAHDHSAPFDELYQTAQRNNIAIVPPDPGPLTSVKGERLNRTGGEVMDNEAYVEKPKIPMADDGFPRSVFSLRKMCRDRSIPVTNKDSRVMLVDKLVRYMNNGENAS